MSLVLHCHWENGKLKEWLIRSQFHLSSDLHWEKTMNLQRLMETMNLLIHLRLRGKKDCSMKTRKQFSMDLH